MVEYNCQKFLNKFLEKKVLLKYNKDRKNALLITETRPSLNLILVIKNALSIFKNHNLIVVGSIWVFKLIEKFIGNEFHKININKIKISIKEYSNLLTDKNFWSKIIKLVDNYKEEEDSLKEMMKIQEKNNDRHTINYNLLK